MGVDYPEWMQKPLMLVLDHEDGQRRNNELNNLRLVCPNCNVQQKTFAGANAGRIEDIACHEYVIHEKDGTKHLKVWMTGGLAMGGEAGVEFRPAKPRELPEVG